MHRFKVSSGVKAHGYTMTGQGGEEGRGFSRSHVTSATASFSFRDRRRHDIRSEVNHEVVMSLHERVAEMASVLATALPACLLAVLACLDACCCWHSRDLGVK
jgi:hypothetical protein